jgi:putative nucleotidyltransferase with HDIG domain
MLALLAYFAHERTQRLKHLLELNETYRGTAVLLGEVIGADDAYTGAHSHDVVHLAVAVAEQLGLTADRKRNIEFGALLHDIGKIAVPNRIINKPGKLTDEEWAIMKTHCAEGEKMLARIGGFMTEVGTIARNHHERWDGNGYPDGLIGDASPMESRIITACDSWNAMTTTAPTAQPWRRKRPLRKSEPTSAPSSTPRSLPRCSRLSLPTPDGDPPAQLSGHRTATRTSYRFTTDATRGLRRAAGTDARAKGQRSANNRGTRKGVPRPLVPCLIRRGFIGYRRSDHTEATTAARHR